MKRRGLSLVISLAICLMMVSSSFAMVNALPKGAQEYTFVGEGYFLGYPSFEPDSEKYDVTLTFNPYAGYEYTDYTIVLKSANETLTYTGQCWRMSDYFDGNDGGNVGVKFEFVPLMGEVVDRIGRLNIYDSRLFQSSTLVLKEDTNILEKVISGVATSKTGEYMVSIGGKVKGEFSEGRQQITPSGQEITIFAMNTINGATRVMNANTINSMYVTVEGGVITKVEIAGRVQTSPGGYDTYSFVG